MEKLILEQQVTKEQALDGIMEVLTRFDNLLLNIRDKSKLTAGSELYRFADFIINKNYSSAFRKLNWTIFDNLSSEGYENFLLKCKTISDKYELEVTIPRNIKVLGEGIVEDFIADLTQDAFDAIARNRTELVIEKNVLLEQVGQLDFNDEKYTKLEWIIKSKQAFNVAKAENDRATEEITNLACSHQIDGYDPWYKMQKESEERMQAIITECPFVIFFSGKSDTKKVEKEINALVKKINSGLDGVEEKIRNGTYPIWELTPLISNLLKKDKYQGKEEVILKEFDKWRSDKYKKDLFLTIGSVVLSVAGILIPGGCSFGLLLAKAVTTTAGAAMGIAQSVDEFTQAGINKDTAYASLRLSDDQIALVENADVSEATKEYILSGVFLGLGIFDVADSVKSVKLIFKLDKLDDVTRLALKNSKRFGAKAFQNCDVDSLTKIGKNLPEPHAIEIFNMKNTVNVVDSLGTKAKPKVFANLSSLEAPKVPVALDFFPDNLNKNIIWLSIVDKPADVISEVKYTEVFEELAKRAEKLTNADPKAIENYLTSVSKAFSQEELVIVSKVKEGTELPEIGIRLQNGAYNGFCKNEDIQQVFFTKLDEIAGKSYDGGRSPIENLMKRLGFTDEDVAKNMKIFDNPDGRMYLDVVVSRDKSVFRSVNWDDVEDRFIKYVNSLDNVELKAYMTDYPLIFEGNKINKSKLDEMFFNAFKSKEATQNGFADLNHLQTKFFNEVLSDKFNINKYYTGQGFTATIDEKVFGTGEMVLESTGKETLPLSNKNYMTYRYSVDKDCNIKLYNVYD